MSTNRESSSSDGSDHPTLPPEWEARPGYDLLVADVLAPDERHRWIRWALNAHVIEIRFVRSLEEIADTCADLALVSHERLAGGPDEFRLEIARRWREEPDTLWVVIDAPGRARVTYQWTGADVAIGHGTAAMELSARVSALIRRAQTERDRSPLTGLPGNRWLRRYLQTMLADGQSIALIMADIDDFKGYNDRYGHLAGDELIVRLAEVLREAKEPYEAFLAHVGGDDFAVVCRPGKADGIAGRAEADFARRRANLSVDEPPEITIVSTTIAPDEADDLQGAFERVAGLRRARRRRD